MSLRSHVAVGVKWSSISFAGQHFLQVVTSVLLARLLPPSEIGLMTLIMVVVGFVTLFGSLGMSQAIIQHQHLSEDVTSSVFLVNLAFGVIATLLALVLAPTVAWLYRQPQVIAPLRLCSVTFIVSALAVVPHALLERALAFHVLWKVEIAGAVVGCLTGVGAAWMGCGVWSLVYQVLASAMVTTIFLWMVSSWRPHRLFRWSAVRSVSQFSVPLVGFNLFNYLARNADYILIGRQLGTLSLGYYTLAYRLLLSPLHSVSDVIGRVTFPAYSLMQDDHGRLGRAYLETVGAIAAITFPMMVGLTVLSEPFVLAVFGAQWAPAIPLVRILAPVGMVQSIVSTLGTLYQAKGRTDWFFWWGFGVGIAATLSFMVGLRWGVLGVATAYAIVSILVAYPSFVIPFHLIHLRVSELGRVLWRPFFCSATMGAALLVLQMMLPHGLPSTLVLGLLVSAGAVIYAGSTWLINWKQMRELLVIAGARG